MLQPHVNDNDDDDDNNNTALELTRNSMAAVSNIRPSVVHPGLLRSL